MTKLRSQVEGLSIVLLFAAVVPKDYIVSMTDDLTVDKAGADAVPVGRVMVPAKAADGEGTVETRFKERIEIKADGAVAAGDIVKLAAADGTTGENRAKKWTSQTDAAAGDKPHTMFGLCIKGGADGATLEVLTF